MKNVLLFGPFSWLRRMLLSILVVMFVFGIVLYIAVNSPLVVKKAADTFAPDYNISYSRIHGNIITGVEIEDLAYNKESLAKHITLKWNPTGLFRKKIIVNTLKIKEANVDVIKSLIASFDTNTSVENNENNVSEPFDFVIVVNNLELSLEPFVEQGVSISKMILDTKQVEYTSDSLNVNKLNLNIDSNVTNIRLSGSLNDQKAQVKTLSITDVDTLALRALFATDNNESNGSETIVSSELNDSKIVEKNPLIPRFVVIDDVRINLLPAVVDPWSVNHLRLEGKDIIFNVDDVLVQKGQLDLNGSSNLSNIVYTGKIKDNQLAGRIHLIPNEKLFELYALPVRKEAIGDIFIDFNASRERVVADVKAKATQLLKSKKGEFNVDIESLSSHVVYDVKENGLRADSKMTVHTPYAKNIFVSNLFMMDKNISYSGEINAKELTGIDENLTKLLQNLQVKYRGDDTSIQTELLSDNIKGYFNSPDFKNGILHLETKNTIYIDKFIALPKELKGTEANIMIDAPIEFDSNLSIKAKAKIISNVANIEADIVYNKILQINTVSILPQESLLRAYSKEVKWDNLNPIKADIKLVDDEMKIILNTGVLTANVDYALKSKQIDAKVTVAGLSADISGITDKKIIMNTQIESIQSVIKNLQSIYVLDTIPITGKLNLSVEVTELKTIDLSLQSPSLIYQANRGTRDVIDDIDMKLSMDDSNVVLDHYKLTYNKMKFFSTKPSMVNVNGDIMHVGPLWLNDELKVEGDYNLKTKKGNISTQANKFHVARELVDLDSKIDIQTLYDGNKTSINGTVFLLGGDIHYDISQKSFASDSDILIVQEMKEKKESPFMDNLSVSVQIQTKQPLIYKQGDINIKANVDLNAYKTENADLMVLGSVEILKGGTYNFEGKQFVLQQSHIYFTGDPNKPMLEGSVKYQSPNHLITIHMSGTADAPNINFSSKPSLTKEQILSIILFDSEVGAGTNSGEDMMKMMGGAMAKSVLSNIGVKIDHLVFGAGNSVEIGKKLSDKITIIYINDIVSSVKLKYQHSKNIESVIEASEVSQSYDIIYKKDF